MLPNKKYLILFISWPCHGIHAMNQTRALALGAWSPNHWTARELLPKSLILKWSKNAPAQPSLQFKLCLSPRGIISTSWFCGSMAPHWWLPRAGMYQLPLWWVVWEQCRRAARGRQSYPFISLGGALGWSQHGSFSSGTPSAPYQLLDISRQISSPFWASISLSTKGEIGTAHLIRFFSLTPGFSALFFLKGMNPDIFKIFPKTIHRPVTEGEITTAICKL